MRARLLETISDGSLQRVVPLRKRWKQVAAAIALLCLLGLLNDYLMRAFSLDNVRALHAHLHRNT